MDLSLLWFSVALVAWDVQPPSSTGGWLTSWRKKEISHTLPQWAGYAATWDFHYSGHPSFASEVLDPGHNSFLDSLIQPNYLLLSHTLTHLTHLLLFSSSTSSNAKFFVLCIYESSTAYILISYDYPITTNLLQVNILYLFQNNIPVPTQVLTNQEYSPTQVLTNQEYSPTQVLTTQENSPTQVLTNQEYSPTQALTTQEYSPTQVLTTQEYSPTQVLTTQENSPTQVLTTQEYSPTQVFTDH